jgi:hypothetical protein
MKRKLFLFMAAILAAALAITGCETEDRGEPEYGDNLITDAAMLAATGVGNTVVTKEGDKYKVSGKVTDDSYWKGDVNWITVTINADPDDTNKYFAGVKRYTITCEFPDISVKPYDNYDQGLDIYFENIKATANTDLDEGNWQSVPMDEYNAVKGVGTMTVDKNLTEYYNSDTNKSNVGDYHRLVIRIKFPATYKDRDYYFYISNVGIYGEKIDDTYPVGELETPVIHANSMLTDAAYTVGDAAVPLRVVLAWTENRDYFYTYEWYSNTDNSTTGGTLIPADKIGDNNDYPGGWQSGTKFIPPTDAAGTFYYYVVVSFEGRSTTSRVVKIEVTGQ